MKKAFLTLLLIFGVSLGVWTWFGSESRFVLSPAEILGGVVRIEEAGVDRLYYLTSQWEKRVTYRSGRASAYQKTANWLNVDLWEFDSTTAQPLSRRRIKCEKVNGDAKALGVEQGVLWARIPELVGIRLADGAIVVDAEKIAAHNPKLAGLIPKPPLQAIFLTEAMQPLKFDPQAGMIMRLDDAREVRIDPLTMEATPYVASKSSNGDSLEDAATVSGKKVIRPANGMDWNTMVRALPMSPTEAGKEWLGLLTESDLEMMKEGNAVTPQMDFSKPQRSRLYRTTLKEVTDGYFIRQKYENPTVLPESPDFLMGGLLTQETSDVYHKTALSRSNPESLFVLSLDRLGEQGRLQLARVAREKGAPVWSVALPLSDLSAWIPGERHALMLGPAPAAERSPMAEDRENPAMHILSIDLTTGAVQSFNPDLHRDWPVEKVPQEN